MQNSADRHLTTADLAARWSRAPRTLINMRSRGEGPAFLKINGHAVRYRLSDVEAYEAASLSEAA